VVICGTCLRTAKPTLKPIKGFNALCKHLKVKDGPQHTVIGIQLENESGILGSDRDYGPKPKIFDSPVPKALISAMKTAVKARLRCLAKSRRQAVGKLARDVRMASR